MEQQELLRRQLHVLTIERHGVAIRVDGDAAVVLRPGGRRAAGASEERGDACDDFFGAERLGDVVVGAELEARDPIGFLTACSEHDDRNGRDGRIGAHRLTDDQPVHARKHEVKDHEVRPVLAKLREHFAARHDALDAMASLLEIVREQRCDIAVVFDDKNVGHVRKAVRRLCATGAEYNRVTVLRIRTRCTR